ncbi:MAG: hydroxyacylglutathione hydrolase [Rhodocyclaceae bacterium]|nr:hydroxyacylglutathione hydrolase [Rhodocyclaceae bacterium]
MEIIPIPAFTDNYVWLIRSGNRAVVVDPGDAAPVKRYLARHDLTLAAILITHHHADHTGGIGELARPEIPVFGPAGETIAGVTHPVAGGDSVQLDAPRLLFEVIDVPGHTRGHIAFHGHSVLFCGDTLFNAGCGRVFEGTPEQLHHSLQALMTLPPETRVFCTHEYTLANLAFAAAAEPDNPARDRYAEAMQALRDAAEPTLPTDLATQREINPFVRCDSASVRATLDLADATDEQVFTALRDWKNRF